MFTLPNFCRVCLKYDKNLIDLAHIENEPSETLMSKLQLCVAEVEWSTFKPLLCHPCIKRLNIAYSFKKQCVQSAGVLKNYVELVKESQKKNESQSAVKTENVTPGGAYMLLPNQKYVKILVGSQNQGTTGNTFQNVFLNLIPTTALNTVTTPVVKTSTPKTKDTNQNVFLNLNNTFQKFVPIAPLDSNKQNVTPKKSDVPKLSNNVNVTQLLTESKAEEMSVEIDPTSFLQLEHDDEDDSNEEEEANDWDEVITQTKIDPNNSKITNGEKANGKESYGNYVPILPKQEDFFSSGHHFLSGSFEANDISCETCQKTFSSVRLLKHHIKQYHLGKLPFKCEYCYTDHATRNEYDACVNRHKVEAEALTLQDFKNPTFQLNDSLSISLMKASMEANILPNENGDYVCDVCRRVFTSSTGMLRHKVRKHNQKNKKKYFIKGMKNARCDICNREFSTQSYMQLHRKLHLRDDVGYKYKVLGKSKYTGLEESEKEKEEKAEGSEEKGEGSESIEVTPDIKPEMDDDGDDDDDDEGSSEEEEEEVGPVNKKSKIEEEGSNDSLVRQDQHNDASEGNGEEMDEENSNSRSEDNVDRIETDNGESEEGGEDDEEDVEVN